MNKIITTLVILSIITVTGSYMIIQSLQPTVLDTHQKYVNKVKTVYESGY